MTRSRWKRIWQELQRLVVLTVGTLVAAMAGPLFAKTTGVQLPIDGGNERVI
jgi:hypothetical protein